MLTKSLIACTLALRALCAVPALGQEVVNTNRATDVRAHPDDAALVLQMLMPQTKVDVLERRGAWMRVKTDLQTGWVRMMHLRGGVIVTPTAPPSTGGSLMSGLNRLLGGDKNPNPRAQAATLGVRGLSPEELKAAKPNAQQLAALKSQTVNAADAERFAKEVPLAVVQVTDPADVAKGARQ